MNSKEVLQTIRQRKPPISIIGESMNDVWYYGNAREPSQQNPAVGKFVSNMTLHRSGGAANVRTNVATLTGDTVHHMTSGLVSQRYRWWDTDKDAMVFRYDVNQVHGADWLSRIRQLRENVVVADYGRGMISWERVITLSKERPEKIVFSPHLRNCHKDCFLHEGKAISGWTVVVSAHEYMALSGKSLASKIDLPFDIIITRGPHEVGIGKKGRNDFAETVPVGWSRPKNPPHTVGIGDVFLAAFSSAHFSGIGLRESVVFAIAVCRSVLEKRCNGTCAFMEGDLA